MTGWREKALARPGVREHIERVRAEWDAADDVEEPAAEPDQKTYVNGDDGYLWLTCGRCEESLHCIDAGDTLDALNAAERQHQCE